MGENFDNNGNKVHLLHIPREIIIGIVFGLDFSEDLKLRILEKMKSDDRYKNIVPYNSEINRENRSIDIKQIL